MLMCVHASRQHHSWGDVFEKNAAAHSICNASWHISLCRHMMALMPASSTSRSCRCTLNESSNPFNAVHSAAGTNHAHEGWTSYWGNIGTAVLTLGLTTSEGLRGQDPTMMLSSILSQFRVHRLHTANVALVAPCCAAAIKLDGNPVTLNAN